MAADKLYQQAHDLHYKSGDTQEAHKLYMQVVAEHPDSKEAGYAKSQLANIDKAGGPKAPEPEASASSGAGEPAIPLAARCTRCGAASRLVPDQGQYWCDSCELYVIPPPAAAGAAHVAKVVPPKTPPFSSVGQVLILLGGVALALGPFLPWVSISGIMSQSVSGMQKTNNEAIILVGLGALPLLAAIASFSQKKNALGPAAFLGAIGGGSMTAFYYSQISDHLAGFDGGGLAQVTIGGGLYLCFAGCAFVLVGLGVASSSG